MELAARLSDRPSADRDLAFLFRLAAHKVPTTRPMLESLVRGSLNDPASVRAASYLVRDFARVDLLGPLRDCAASAPREELHRGLALGALWDAGDLDVAAARAPSSCRRSTSARWRGRRACGWPAPARSSARSWTSPPCGDCSGARSIEPTCAPRRRVVGGRRRSVRPGWAGGRGGRECARVGARPHRRQRRRRRERRSRRCRRHRCRAGAARPHVAGLRRWQARGAGG